jgi:D-alanyl-lipoteichoic acid acyltransferase DltB (MBOAT superfamily)
MLLVASCIFYMAFVPAYIAVLFVTILIDYLAALRIERSSGERRRAWLLVSICATCLVLFVFKYFDFFSESVTLAARSIGMSYFAPTLRLLLPVGLSFHTFQSLSYVAEVYRGRQRAEASFPKYALYVMFYPQLVAGPIERPQNLLHQFDEIHEFDYGRVVSGLQLMAWGFIKKLVVADRLAEFANRVYDAPAQYTGLPLIVGTVAFAFQIYCDFSGYSDIAIGAAQVMGFRLMRNFDHPYIARSVSEFWRRWHISLSSWFRDYVYLPLGGNRVARPLWLRNLFITFLISGLWHGARWTFVIWGALHGCYVIASILSSGLRARVRHAIGWREHHRLISAWQIGVTFTLVGLAWIFFRATSLHDAWYVLTHLLTGVSGQLTEVLHSADARYRLLYLGHNSSQFVLAAMAVVVLLVIERLQRRGSIRVRLAAQPAAFRWAAYSAAVVVMMTLGIFGSAKFIYFQF